MSNSGYITLLDWMVRILHLNGNELIIYGIIHGYSQDGKSTYSGSTSYLQETSGASLRCVKDVLEKLVAKGLLIKKDEKSCIITLPDGSQRIKKAQGGANHFCKYYTAISRDQKLMDTFTLLSNNSKDTDKKSYGKTYITILNWMVKNIGLTSNELVIYAIIHGFSQNGTSYYWGSIEYLSQISGASVRCVINILEKLVKKGLLVKLETNNRIYEKEDGQQVIQKSQGGANHFCKYYTAVSRNTTILDSFKSLQKVPSAISAYGELSPTANSALGKPSAISAHGSKKPTADSALGDNIPSAINADATSAKNAYATSANSAYNNKYNNKIETTTTQSYNLWNLENLDFILETIFGSGGLFQTNFKNRLITFLNSKELNIATAKKYLEWAYEQAKVKAKTDELGYFITVIDRDSFYSQFLYYNKSNELEEDVSILHCPVCDSVITKNQLECPCCHTDVADFSDSKNIKIKRNIWFLPPDKKVQLEQRVKEIGTSMLTIHGNRFNGEISIDELQVKTNEVYKEFGVLEEV